MDANKKTIKFLGMNVNKDNLIKDIKEMILGAFMLSIACAFLYVFKIGCPIKFVTGISCPGCGMTRAVMCFIRFDFKGGIMYHPMIISLPVIVFLYLFRNNINKRLYNGVLIAIIVAFISVYVARMASGSRVVAFEPANGLIYKLVCYCMKYHI